MSHEKQLNFWFEIRVKFGKNLQSAIKMTCMESFSKLLQYFTKTVLQKVNFPKMRIQIEPGMLLISLETRKLRMK